MTDIDHIAYLSAHWELAKLHKQPTQGLGKVEDADPEEHRDHGGES